jgi:hypothetical protein
LKFNLVAYNLLAGRMCLCAPVLAYWTSGLKTLCSIVSAMLESTKECNRSRLIPREFLYLAEFKDFYLAVLTFLKSSKNYGIHLCIQRDLVRKWKILKTQRYCYLSDATLEFFSCETGKLSQVQQMKY